MGRGWLVFAMVWLLTGCASNMATVGAFGKSTQELASQTVAMLTQYAEQCGERLAIIERETSILDQAAIYWRYTSPHRPKEAQLAQAAIAQARQSLSPYEGGLRVYCPMQKERLIAGRSIGDVLLSYANSLQALSSDNFVTYNPKLDGVLDSLAQLPGVDGQTLLNHAQVGAVHELAQLVYQMAINGYRQKQLVQAMGPAQRAELMSVAQTLTYLANAYLQGFDKEQIELAGLSSVLAALLQAGVLPEPLAVTEVQRQVRGAVVQVDGRRQAIRAYLAALNQLETGFDLAAKSIQQSPAKDIARGVIDFGRAVYRTQAALDQVRGKPGPSGLALTHILRAYSPGS